VNAPEYFADNIEVRTSSAIITLTLSEAGHGQKANIKIPPQLAKQMAILLRKQIKEMERRGGFTILVKNEWLERVGVAPEDW